MKKITRDICGINVAKTYPYGRLTGRYEDYGSGFLHVQKEKFDICLVCEGKILEAIDKVIEEIKSSTPK